MQTSAMNAIIRSLAAGGLLLALISCSSSNNRAPAPGRSHPARYLLDHAEAANADLTSCRGCHQADLKGGGRATSCFACHDEGDGSGTRNDFGLHSLPYTDPDQHGAAARNDQSGCLACHGTAPNRFDGGILADGALYGSTAPNCNSAACHPAAGAHPTNWQGSNDTDDNGYSASHRVVTQAAIDTGCALCHQVADGGSAPLAEAPSCFSASFTNSDGSTTGCHVSGPGQGVHAIPFAAPDLHGEAAKNDLTACQACHGSTGNTDFDGGVARVSCATAACHPAAGAHPTRWQGGNDVTADYASSHRDADYAAAGCAICHDVTEGRTAPNTAAPSCFSASFTNSEGSTTGCHDSGLGQSAHALPYAPPDLHGAAARADLAGCQACHGTPGSSDFHGGSAAVSCATAACHPAAYAHPTGWQGDNDTNGNGYAASHRVVSQVAIDTGCALCHQVVDGGQTPLAEAPSCFSATFTNGDGSTTGCHTSGPGEAAHALPYAPPDLHGAAARADLAGCQACHGTPASTDFDGGVARVSCATAACHPAAGAHPTRWQGDNDTTAGYTSSHRDAANAETGCAICHDVTEGRSAPNTAAPSCFSARFTNSDGSATACHSTGPGTVPHALPYSAPERHGDAAKADLSECQTCHGSPGGTGFNGGIAATGCASSACHPAAGAHPTHWQGDNDPTANYGSSHRDAGRQDTACAICHDVTQGRPAPNSAAPSCFSTSFTNSDNSASGCHNNGPGAAHALPFTDPADHGPEAKADLSTCVACHATPANAGPGDNPRFNVPVGDLPQGCETSGCHSPYTAHTVPLWSGAETTSHVSAGHQAEACALCHGPALGGGSGAVGPACTSCHELGSPLTLGNCTSCHATPPDEADNSAGSRPNRDGAHGAHQGYSGVTDNCTVCHSGAGAHTDNHFDTGAPATIRMLTTYNSQGSTAGFDVAGSTCSSVRCHGGQATPNWYGGSINIATDCESCHAYGSSEYNGYSSGGHGEHRRLSCSRCHDTAELADPNSAHLSNLATTAFEQNALDTVLPLSRSCQQSGCHGSGTDFGDWWDD